MFGLSVALAALALGEGIRLSLESPHTTYDCADYMPCAPIPASQYWIQVGVFLGIGVAFVAVAVWSLRQL